MPVTSVFRFGFATLLFIALWAHSGPAKAQAVPTDVEGWQSTVWGMSPDELEAVLGADLTKEASRDAEGEVTPGFFIYRIPNYKVFGETFGVEFRWRNSNELIGVVVGSFISSDDDEDEITWRIRDRGALARKIESALLQKYGGAELIEDTHEQTPDRIFESGASLPGLLSIDRRRRWTFPSTIITLSYTRFVWNGRMSWDLINIEYVQNESGKL